MNPAQSLGDIKVQDLKRQLNAGWSVHEVQRKDTQLQAARKRRANRTDMSTVILADDIFMVSRDFLTPYNLLLILNITEKINNKISIKI